MNRPLRSRLSLSYYRKSDAQDAQQIETTTLKEDTGAYPPEDNKVDSTDSSQESKLVQLTLDSLLQKCKKPRDVVKKVSKAASTSGGQSTSTGLPPQDLTQFKKEKCDFLRVNDEHGRFPCIWCKRSFSTAYNLSRHSLKHKDKKNKQFFSCPECGVKFDRTDNLKKHLCSHKSDRPHVCSLCRRRFKHKCHLNVHIKLDRCFKQDLAKYY